MRQITFGNPVLKVEGLEVKFDVVPVSSSLAVLLGDKDLASIVQQLYYWGLQGYGEVIDGVRWIYKPIKEWIAEVFPTFTPYQLGKLMAQLAERGIIRREKLFTKHQIQSCDRFWWQPKNQTYYYSLNTEKLQELADNYQLPDKKAETPKNSVFIKTQKLSNQEFQDTKFFDCSKNNTKNTSIENNAKDKSHPTLPKNECEEIKTNNQEKEPDSNLELPNSQAEKNKASCKAIERDITSAHVEQNINQDISTNERVVREDVRERKAVREDVQVAEETKPIIKLKPNTPRGTKPKRKDQAPWKDEGQFKRFYRALIQALPIVANAHSPQGLAQTIIAKLRRGEPNTYWDDFINGLPIGTSTKPEWEVEPGVPYPMFIEYLTEKLKAGNNTKTDEQTRNEVFGILDKPRQAKAFWGQFKRSVVNVSEQVERDRALGVSNPNTPVWTRERIEPSLSEAEEAGQKIMAVNHDERRKIESVANPQLKSQKEPPTSDPWTEDNKSLTISELLSQSKVKGLTKAMPKVSSETAEAEAKAESEAYRLQRMNRKTHINQMSINEINELLTDPIVRKELTSQIIFNNKFDVVTDNLGEILSVKINQEYSKNKEKY